MGGCIGTGALAMDTVSRNAHDKQLPCNVVVEKVHGAAVHLPPLPAAPLLPCSAVVAAWYLALVMSQFKWFICPRTVSSGGSPDQPSFAQCSSSTQCHVAMDVHQGISSPSHAPLLLSSPLPPAHCVPRHPLLAPAPPAGSVHLAAHAVRRGPRNLPPSHLPPGRPPGRCRPGAGGGGARHGCAASATHAPRHCSLLLLLPAHAAARGEACEGIRGWGVGCRQRSL